MKANRNSLWQQDDRAQVGIGTMIVFIATILVAATAAAVLIDTSGKLSERSASTGNEATKQVSSNLVVLSVTGERWDTATNALYYLNITVALAPGAAPVDVEQIRIQYSDGGSATIKTLSWVTGTLTAGNNQFSSDFVRDADTTANTMNAGDQVELWIDLNANSDTLAPRTDASIQIMPEVGSPVDAGFTSPDTFGTDQFFVLR